MRFLKQLAFVLVPKTYQNLSWRRLGTSGARLGGLLERLERVLERLGLLWERPVGVLVRLGAYGARMERVFKRPSHVRTEILL